MYFTPLTLLGWKIQSESALFLDVTEGIGSLRLEGGGKLVEARQRAVKVVSIGQVLKEDEAFI